MQRATHLALLLLPCVLVLYGCGTYVPQIEEAWEAVDVTPSMETRIKENIFCETLNALRDVNRNESINGIQVIPNDYGVQMQINLEVEEAGAINPSIGYNDQLLNGVVHKIITVPQSFALNGAANLSSTATRTDTSYSYYNVGKITAPGANPFCNDPHNPLDLHGSSPLLKSDLGISAFLREAAPAALIFASSAPASGGAGKSAKWDVFSYDIKFAVVTNASVNPVWKLVNLTAGAGALPLLNLGRTRTHELVLTFGPGTNSPTDFALETHFTGQIVQSNMQRGQGIQ
jgi:hypothetical protein